VPEHLAATDVDPTPMIAELVRGQIARSERIAGTRANALRRVELTDGRVLGVKHYARGRSYATEGAALRVLGDAVPAPEIACTLDRVIAYRWIDGVTLAEALRRDPTTLSRLAAPLGQLLGVLARCARPAPVVPGVPGVDVAAALAQLAHGPTRAHLGDELADALRRVLEATRFDEPTCFVHGELSADHVIVAPALDRIAGVIDWETATAGSPLVDVGRLLRGHRDVELDAAVERAHGGLPADWRHRARVLDAARILEAGVAERPTTLRDVLAEIAASTA
jgi:aminoglycoside phosphotransferase (APT) family kinase protein